jgi:guanylate kinase
MKKQGSGQLFILTGPSCVGKSPLVRSLERFYPRLWKGFQQLVLYNDRDPRPGEADGVQYHFRSRAEIQALEENPDFLVLDVRGDLQALDRKELKKSLQEGNVFYEGNPYLGTYLQESSNLADITKKSVFLSPLSKEEIFYLQDLHPPIDLPALVTDIMRRKLLRRTRKQKGELSLPDLKNIEQRAGAAYQELQYAHRFNYVLPTHDGEDSENWDGFYYPLGEARIALQAVAALLQEERSDILETWEEDLLP